MSEQVRIYNDTTLPPLPAKKINRENPTGTSNLRLFGCAFIASLGLFCNGVFVGWSSQASGMLPDTFSGRKKAWISSSLALGAAISPLLAYKIWNKIGLKTCIIFSALLMVLASPMLAISQCYWSLFAGRFIGGLALGIIHFFVPIYISDISAPENRKTYRCIAQTQFAAGILTMYITGLFQSFLLSSITSATVPLIFMVTFFFMPESPRYLCTKDHINTAREIIAKFKEIDLDVEHSLKVWSHEDNVKSNSLSSIFNGSFGVRLLITVFGLILFEQLIGAIALFFYMHKVLTFTGGDYSPDMTAILCLTIFIASIIFPNFYGQKYKPKTVLLWSIGLMGLSLVALGSYCHYMATFGKYSDSSITEFPLYLLGAFYFFFALGPFRLIWFFVEKMLPEENYLVIRCWLISSSWLLVCGITRVLPGLIDFVGVGWIYWYMAFMCLFTAIFVSIFVPKFKLINEENHKLFSNSESTSENDV